MCASENADLVIIKDHVDNRFIYDMVSSKGVDVWIGIKENVSC